MSEYTTHSAAQTKQIGVDLGSRLKPGDMIALFGEWAMILIIGLLGYLTADVLGVLGFLAALTVLFAALSAFDLDNYVYGLQSSMLMPFKDLIEILLTHYENLSLFKHLPSSTAKEEVKEEPIITEI